jgi:transposase, IS30 family
MQKYTRLTEGERWQIKSLLTNKNSLRQIAQLLNRSVSTISREIKRNKNTHRYNPEAAESKAKQRHKARNQRRRKIKNDLFDLVIAKLIDKWSPVQISGWLKKEGIASVSHETIYRRIYDLPKAALKQLFRHLRHGGRKYQRRDKRKYAGRGYIPARVDIDERPAIVAEKSRIGDWELDTIVGKNHQGYIVSMVERFSKYTKLVLVKNAKAETVKTAIEMALLPFKNSVLTMTSDNGKEFSSHLDIANNLDANFYFAKPYHSWERGLNEHTNGLVRQYFPKKTNFLNITEQDLQLVENALNNRPRKVLNFFTPQQIFCP